LSLLILCTSSVKSYARFLYKDLNSLSGFETVLNLLCFHLFQNINLYLPKFCYSLAWHTLVFLVNRIGTESFFTLKTRQLPTRNALLYNFLKYIVLPPCAPSSIINFEFFDYDDSVVKFRIPSLQPTGLTNLMKKHIFFKKCFNMPR
jgi:hypothetical protein